MNPTKALIITALLSGTTIAVAPNSFATDTETVSETPQHTNYHETVEQIAEAIEAQYPIKSIADRIVNSLQELVGNKALPAEEESFLTALNDTLWASASDLHLKVYNEAMLDKKYRSRGMRIPQMRRVAAPQSGRTDIQPRMMPAGTSLGTSIMTGSMINTNTGLISINSAIYNNPEVFDRALKEVANAASVIIDLRKVPGGSMPGVRLFLSQFFSEPTHVSSNISRRFDEPRELWTETTKQSAAFGQKDLYILTSKRSASGAEAVAFAFKNTGRATLVGEKTAGAGNAGAFLPVGNGLTLFLPMSQTINPKTGKAWEGLGVQPHIEATADDALEAALKAIADKA